MAPRAWRKISEAVLFANPWWTYRLDRFETPSGYRGEYHYMHTPGSAMVVPVADDGSLVMVWQYRFLVQRESIEFPGGGVRSGASHEQAARSELAEETGLGASRLNLLGRFNPFNGMTDEMCHVFLARDLHPAAGALPDKTEELEVLRLAPGDLDARIRDGVVWDGMTIAAWHLARLRLLGGSPT